MQTRLDMKSKRRLFTLLMAAGAAATSVTSPEKGQQSAQAMTPNVVAASTPSTVAAIAALAEKAPSNAVTKPAVKDPGAITQASPGKTGHPLKTMRITSNYGVRKHPILKRKANHHGVDLAARLNEPVRAVYAGKVTYADWRGGYGNTVKIYHPSLKKVTLYAHLNEITAEVGDTVTQGQIIGRAGTTGRSTGVHLHFGVANSRGIWTEPLAFLNRVADASGGMQMAMAEDVETTHIRTRKSTPVKPRIVPTRAKQTLVVARVKKTTETVGVAQTTPRTAKQNARVIAKQPAKTGIESEAKIAAVVANKKTPQAPKVEIAEAPRMDTGALQVQYEAAAKQAQLFSKLYAEGAVSRNDRDQRVAMANELQAELKAAGK